jgi:hypothetical protein
VIELQRNSKRAPSQTHAKPVLSRTSTRTFTAAVERLSRDQHVRQFVSCLGEQRAFFESNDPYSVMVDVQIIRGSWDRDDLWLSGSVRRVCVCRREYRYDCIIED